MNKEITYAVFQNKKTGKKLVYYPVAKNANSSAKLFFLKHLKIDKNYYFLADMEERLLKKGFKRSGDPLWYVAWPPTREPMETIVLQNSVAKSIQSFEVDHTFFDKTLRALVDRDYVCFQDNEQSVQYVP